MSEGNGTGDLEHMPGHLLRRCQQIAVAIFLQECRSFDLTPLQYAVLRTLADLGEMDQSRLGGLTALDRTTIGTVIRNLEGRTLLRRRRSSADRRHNAISCTRQGRDLLAKADAAVAVAQDRILAPLPPKDRVRFLQDLQKIADGNNAESRAPLRG